MIPAIYSYWKYALALEVITWTTNLLKMLVTINNSTRVPRGVGGHEKNCERWWVFSFWIFFNQFLEICFCFYFLWLLFFLVGTYRQHGCSLVGPKNTLAVFKCMVNLMGVFLKLCLPQVVLVSSLKTFGV